MTAQQDIFTADGGGFYSIPPGRAFLTDLAAGVCAAADLHGLSLPDFTIYLPTRRAMRALGEAFLAVSDKKAVLVPRIRALGDIDEDEFVLFSGGAGDEISLAPALGAEQRRLMLARIIAERDKAYFDGQRSWAGAISAADELSKLLDSLYTEEIDAGRLAEIVPDALAAHWRHSLEFLSIIVSEWPKILQSQGAMDPAARRAALIDKQAKHWADAEPRKPILVAGTTGSAPAVARMMGVVAQLPMGAVVLPGLDLTSSDSVWDAIDEPHPQSGLKALLEAIKIKRKDVRLWPSSGVVEKNPRTDLLTIALRPADASDEWRDWAQEARSSRSEMDVAIRGLSQVEASDEEREAAIIALKLRETIETPGRTAMLVTPDRNLARRVSLKMRRWGVNVDDSAGTPFANTPCGAFLRLAAQWLCDPGNPVSLMALMDHPLFGGGVSREAIPPVRAQFDRKLRGLTPPGGFEGLRQKLEGDDGLSGEMENVLRALSEAAGAWPGEGANFTARFESHLRAAEKLSAVARGEVIDAMLWRGDDGEAGASLLAGFRTSLDLIAQDRPEEYADIFARLISGATVRRRGEAHPRILILGPLEARMQSADVVILGGLNEGIWPRDAVTDPFLSRPMRRDLGLPSPERRIGLAAHDFAQLTAGCDVMLTRSTRAAGKPTNPSRWIVRLKNILKGADVLSAVEATVHWEGLASLLDKPQLVTQIAQPSPTPPLHARPDALSVTQIEKLLRDPYSIYASKILRLKPLDTLGEQLSPRHTGELFHEILEVIVRERLDGRKDDVTARLWALFEERVGDYGIDAGRMQFRRAQIDEAFRQLAVWIADRERLGAPAVIEGKGVWTFSLDGAEFTLSARADRIDMNHDGGAFIIDYKTGTPPSLKQQPTFSPQLPLTGLIVEAGGFEDLGAQRVSGFSFLRLVGGASDERQVGLAGPDASAMIGDVKDGLFSVLRFFADEKTPYLSQPRPQYANQYGDYDHLARRRERQTQGGEE